MPTEDHCEGRRFNTMLLCFYISVGGADALKIEEMEKMLKEAHLEKARLIESRVRRNSKSRRYSMRTRSFRIHAQ